MYSKLVTILLVLLYNSSVLSYKAAVYEYHPITGNTPNETILENLREYSTFAHSAKDKGVNILVFPEYGLTTLVSDPEEYAIEIRNDDHVITELTAIASEHDLYLVVNMLEKVQESNRATKYFSTTIVFDTDGQRILKYRKINLVDEPKLTAGEINQTVHFTTTFGTTFGLLVSNDMFSEWPGRHLLEDHQDVTDVIYVNSLKSVFPFGTPISRQHGYVLANGVSLLAANYGEPKEGHGGSSIIIANGKIIQSYIYDTTSSQPLVQDLYIQDRQNVTQCQKKTGRGLPDDLGRVNVTNYKTDIWFDYSRYTFKNVDLSQNREQSLEVCNNNFCCNFKIGFENVSQTDTYKVMSFNGFDDHQKRRVQLCSLVACENDDTSTCGKRIDPQTNFTSLQLSGIVPQDGLTVYVPVTVNKYLLPVINTKYCFNGTKDQSSSFELFTTVKQSSVLAFGIMGHSSATTLYGFTYMAVIVAGILKHLVL